MDDVVTCCRLVMVQEMGIKGDERRDRNLRLDKAIILNFPYTMSLYPDNVLYPHQVIVPP